MVLLQLSTATSEEKPKRVLRALPPVEIGLSKTLVDQLNLRWLNLRRNKTLLVGLVSLFTGQEGLLESPHFAPYCLPHCAPGITSCDATSQNLR